MTEQVITFSVNEQELKKTSGIDLYASDTVSYIRAVFDLGTNWTGWDSVRAVWWTPSAKISTVLHDGACIVPQEVLSEPEKVRVNLVASTVENNVVTDRLTSYPIVALVVDRKVRLTGTETTPITPSQFEQFAAAIHEDAETATSARDDAVAAQGAAEFAQGKAEAAQEAAETAQRKAEDAQGFAEEAATAAGNSAADADRSEGEAAAWATGSYSGDGGIPVPASAPQHHNNAKYYSELAAQSADEAGYVTFEIDEDGHLQFTKTTTTDLDFSLDSNGHLILEVA